MNDKPELNSQINPDDFKAHYWLKEELIAFSKMLKISSQGSKEKVTSRLYEYLVNGVIAPEKPNKAKPFSKNRKEESKGISLEDIISENYKNDQKHRAFFKSVIGSHFKFNVAFINWMKLNQGKTYKEAIVEWNRIHDEIKNGKKFEISKQFEYNQYIRDFFKDNKEKTLENAIACWKGKKQIAGNHSYDRTDLKALK